MIKLRDDPRFRITTLMIAISILLNCLIEVLSRRSLGSLAAHIAATPHTFLISSLILLCSFTPALLIKRRAFFLIFVSMVWAGCGIANCVIMILRGSPFTARDILLLRDGLRVISIYLSIWQIILIAAAIAAAIAIAVFAFLKLPKSVLKPGTRKTFTMIAAVIFALTIAVTFFADGVVGQDNALEAYDEYGFAYCFTTVYFYPGLENPMNTRKTPSKGYCLLWKRTIPV